MQAGSPGAGWWGAVHACDNADGGAGRQALPRKRGALQVQQPGAQHDAAAHGGEEVEVQGACRCGMWACGTWNDARTPGVTKCK